MRFLSNYYKNLVLLLLTRREQEIPHLYRWQDDTEEYIIIKVLPLKCPM